MDITRINGIKDKAHQIDYSINLFEGFTPKCTLGKTGESLFWRQVVSIYGIFCDCDLVQIKSKDNLFAILYNADLISKEERDEIYAFYYTISNLRGWFCHNNNVDFYYALNRYRNIKKTLDDSFLIATSKPNNLDEVQKKDWNLLSFNIISRFEKYLNILENALQKWDDSESKNEIVYEWQEKYAKTLYCDRELIDNVLADLYCFQLQNMGRKITQVSGGVKSYKLILKNAGFSYNDIKDVLFNLSRVMSAKEILKKVFYHMIYEYNLWDDS